MHSIALLLRKKFETSKFIYFIDRINRILKLKYNYKIESRKTRHASSFFVASFFVLSSEERKNQKKKQKIRKTIKTLIL